MAGGRRREIALPQRPLALMLISAELTFAFLWALTGALLAILIALTLGLGALLVALLSNN